MPLVFKLENEGNDDDSVSDRQSHSKLTSKKESTEVANSNYSPSRKGNSPPSKKTPTSSSASKKRPPKKKK